MIDYMTLIIHGTDFERMMKSGAGNRLQIISIGSTAHSPHPCVRASVCFLYLYGWERI